MKFATADYVAGLRQTLANAGDQDNAAAMSAYMKHRFPFFGIKAPQREALTGQFFRENGLPPDFEALKAVAQACFDQPERELHYAVKDLLDPLVKKLDPSFLNLYSELLGRQSWWDSVDFIAPKLAGKLLLRFPEQLPLWTHRWIELENFWYQRAAILLQLNYGRRTDPNLLFSTLRRRVSSGEFFVQKASGWALRNYSKVDPGAVRAYLQATPVAPLTRREASKYL